MVNDTIADMLTRIRNANALKNATVETPFTNICNKIALVLLNNGFVKAVETKGEGKDKVIVITLKYDSRGNRVISGLKRISTPGLRIYASVDKVPHVINGLGIAILSTSKGILTDAQCRKEHIGGEVLAFVW